MEKLQAGIYQHYKGGKYELLFVAEQTETKEAMVIYRSLKDQKIWARPLSNWQEKIKQKGESRDRFIKIKEIEEKDFEHQYKLALADYQNLLKRSVKDKAEFAKYALNDFLQELLPVYDHLKMSLSSLPDKEKESAWVQGVEYVLKQFKELLSNRGVEEIKTVGEKFNHDLMEAIEGQGEKVIKEIMSGYTLNGRVIRAAKVVVGN